MSNVIIYPNDNAISVMVPVLECGLTINQIADKDVPMGIPYKIIDASEIPDDILSWQVDFSDPDGYGK